MQHSILSCNTLYFTLPGFAAHRPGIENVWHVHTYTQLTHVRCVMLRLRYHIHMMRVISSAACGAWTTHAMLCHVASRLILTCGALSYHMYMVKTLVYWYYYSVLVTLVYIVYLYYICLLCLLMLLLNTRCSVLSYVHTYIIIIIISIIQAPSA